MPRIRGRGASGVAVGGGVQHGRADHSADEPRGRALAGGGRHRRAGDSVDGPRGGAFGGGGRHRRTAATDSSASDLTAPDRTPVAGGPGNLPRSTRRLRAVRPTTWALAGIVGAAFGVRLWGIGSGLPFVFNIDEHGHFTISAVQMFRDGYNPHYFSNPSGFTLLLHLVMAVRYGGAAGDYPTVVDSAFSGDPTGLFLLTRITTAALGALSVAVLYVAGRRLGGPGVGLAAAAFLAFTFLPVHYSHFALNDAPTLLPLCLSMVGVAGILTRGRWRDHVLAGLGLGLATGFKYTAAAFGLAVVLACLLGRRGTPGPTPARRLAGVAAAVGVAAAAFLLTNPFALLDMDSFVAGVSQQQSASSGSGKLGLDDTPGLLYYLHTLWWGFGAVPVLLALVGVVVLMRHNWRFCVPYLLFGGALLVYMGQQSRFFSRWMLPLYPVLSLFAGIAAVALGRRLAGMLHRRRPATDAGDFPAGFRALPLVTIIAVMVVALAVPLVHVVHHDVALARTDTRTQAREWLRVNVPPGQQAVMEPMAHARWLNEAGAWVGPQVVATPPAVEGVSSERLVMAPTPRLIDDFIAAGVCYVVTASIVRGRVAKNPAVSPQAAVAYYAALERRATRVATFSPMATGAPLPPFSFDFSYNVYDLDQALPGPQVDIYRLTGC